jgi:hypothetical protein
MVQRLVRLAFAAALTIGMIAASVRLAIADDAKTSGETPAPTRDSLMKPPDFSKYHYEGEIVGEIVKADDKKLVLRVVWWVPVNSNTRPRLNGGGHHHRPNMTRPPQMKQMHHDYVLEFVPESLVRTKILPPKLDDNGKKVIHTTKELEELRYPLGAPSYAASPSDLLPGAVVEVRMIRDKKIPADKVTEDDIRVKYAIIYSQNPNGPTPIPGAKTTPTPPKKK